MITLTATAAAVENSSATTSVTATLPNNSLAIVTCYNDGGGTQSFTVAATGLVFRLAASRASGAVQIWVAEVVTGASITFNVTHTAGSVLKRVKVCWATDSSGNIPDFSAYADANNGGGTSSLSYTSTAVGSVGLYAGYSTAVAGAVAGQILLDSHGNNDFAGAGTEDTFLYQSNYPAGAIGQTVTLAASSNTNACIVLEITNAYASAPTPSAVSASAYNTITTKTISVSVNNGDIVVVMGVVADSSADFSTPTGGSLVYSVQQNIWASSYSQLYIWTAKATSTQTFNVSLSLSTGSQHFGMVVAVIPSASVGGSSSANASSGAAAVNLTPKHRNSILFCIIGDWNAASVTTRTWKTINSFTPTAGNGKEITAQQDSGQYSSLAAWWTSVGAPAVDSVGISAPTTLKWVIAAIEIASLPQASTLASAQKSLGFFHAMT